MDGPLFGAQGKTPILVGTRTPRILGRRKWPSERLFFYRLVADGRFSVAQILSEVQWRLTALISGGGFSALLPVFDSNPVG